MSYRLRVALAASLLATGLAAPWSAPAEAVARYRVSAGVQPTSVLVGRHVTVSGKVMPAAPGQVVKVQVATGAGWRTVVTVPLGSRSRYRTTYTPPGVGTYQLRVRKPAAAGERRGTSPTATVTVTPSLPPS